VQGSTEAQWRTDGVSGRPGLRSNRRGAVDREGAEQALLTGIPAPRSRPMQADAILCSARLGAGRRALLDPFCGSGGTPPALFWLYASSNLDYFSFFKSMLWGIVLSIKTLDGSLLLPLAMKMRL